RVGSAHAAGGQPRARPCRSTGSMRPWRRPSPEPVPGPDPGAETADAAAQEAEDPQRREDAPAPVADSSERSAPAASAAGEAEPADRGRWSAGPWRRGLPEPQQQRADPLQPAPDGPVEGLQTAIALEDADGQQRRGWLGRLRAGMARSSARLTEGINTIFNRRRLDDAALLELEALLIASDMGVGIAGEVTEELRRRRFNQEVSPEEVRTALAEQVTQLVEPVMKPLRLDLA